MGKGSRLSILFVIPASFFELLGLLESLTEPRTISARQRAANIEPVAYIAMAAECMGLSWSKE